jgi:hypothetical protein
MGSNVSEEYTVSIVRVEVSQVGKVTGYTDEKKRVSKNGWG